MEILSSTASLIAACAALVGGIAAFLKALVELRNEASVNKSKARRFIGFAAAFFAIGLSLPIAWSLGRRSEAAESEKVASVSESLNAKLTNEAWEAYNRNNYTLAIATARKCIDE